MKKLLILFVAAIPVFAHAQDNLQQKPTTKVDTRPQPKQDDYEMKQYYFVMLTKGARRGEITDTTVLKKIQEGHMSNINRLAEMGKIVLAGPFGDDGNWRGLFIFNAASAQEVEELLKTDPAIAAGRLAYEIHPWWTAKNCLFK